MAEKKCEMTRYTAFLNFKWFQQNINKKKTVTQNKNQLPIENFIKNYDEI